MANSVDPDEMPHSAASHLGLHCLLRPVCPVHMVNMVVCKVNFSSQYRDTRPASALKEVLFRTSCLQAQYFEG